MMKLILCVHFSKTAGTKKHEIVIMEPVVFQKRPLLKMYAHFLSPCEFFVFQSCKKCPVRVLKKCQRPGTQDIIW